MIIYYGIKSDDPPNLAEANPLLALALLSLAIILWVVLLAGYYKSWILTVFAVVKKIERLKNTGIKCEAVILSQIDKSVPNAGYNTYVLNLSFKNFVGAYIEQKLTVNDTKPQERKFEEGNKVEVIVNPNPKDYPLVILSTFEANIKKSVILLFHAGWFAILALVAGYFYYAYQTENEGMGWRFVTCYHPIVTCAAMLLFNNINIIEKLFGYLAHQDPQNDFLIKYNGLPAKAALISSWQTGTYINEQPMVAFELEFTDHNHQKHGITIKKIVDLLDLGSTRQKEIAIFYLQKDPKQIAFASDLNELNVDL
ncbi:hypothetical protein J7E50_23485 [Pedobacter sp. ISL-68]|uniref:DUF3592 domain-containing protein n=1 Tax=unclassified Pedobacter TaxID=2628915 RepID=UPI001BECCAA4|nr:MULTISPECIES: DUF3592 domain-containing protein [unclassified Pedobacter]MBT2564383.1 hypothetical protein [Pedobacter sp. ISL-64]MBT2593203.1 hypothetical protein [Pedobacter sp. ISL-68]